MKDFVTLTGFQLFLAGFHAGSRLQYRLVSSAFFIIYVWKNHAIFDLYKILISLRSALKMVSSVVLGRSKILIANTAPEKELVKIPMRFAGEPFANDGWVGGALTNIKKVWRHFYRYRFRDIYWDHSVSLSFFLLLRRLPGAVFVSNFTKGHLILNEATKLYIPTVSLVDANVFTDRVLHTVYTNERSWLVSYYFHYLLSVQSIITKIRLIVRFGRSKGIFLQRKIKRGFKKYALFSQKK